MALLDDLLKGNVVTALAVGIGAYLLVPTVGPALRPAAKAIIKLGIQACRRSPLRIAKPGQDRTQIVVTRSDVSGAGEKSLSPDKRDLLMFGLVWLVVGAVAAAAILLSPL